MVVLGYGYGYGRLLLLPPPSFRPVPSFNPGSGSFPLSPLLAVSASGVPGERRKAVSRLLWRLQTAPAPVSAPAPASTSPLSVARIVRGVPKDTLLEALRHLLRHRNWTLALPMYMFIREAPWYTWNGQLHAQLVALLTKFQRHEDVASLNRGLEDNLDPRELVKFYIALIHNHATYGLKEEALATATTLQDLPLPSTRLLGLDSLFRAYLSMDLMEDAEEILRKMQEEGYELSKRSYQALLLGYGKCGRFEEMEALAKDGKRGNHTNATFDIVLSTYAASQRYEEVKRWLNIITSFDGGSLSRLSVRSLNGIVSGCPTLISLANDKVEGDSSLLELLRARGASDSEVEMMSLLTDNARFLPSSSAMWSSSQWHLDLHNAYPGTAYLLLNSWLKEVETRLGGAVPPPLELVIVTGWGKHSNVMGKSSVKSVTRGWLERMGSPFRVDSLNKGRFIAKGHLVKAWFNDRLQASTKGGS